MSARGTVRGKSEGGYAVLLAIFMVATLLLFAAAATPNVITEGRRLREQDAIWRGNQYVRAIRIFYQKNGKYPASLEDLTKPNAVGVHFLRKAYKDPMNTADGKWRLIYVTPNGQLVGSVHFHNLQEMAVAAAFAPAAVPVGPFLAGSGTQTRMVCSRANWWGSNPDSAVRIHSARC